MHNEIRDVSQNNIIVHKSKRGFAAMPAEKRQAIARKGGQAVQQKGTAHQFTPEEAKQAGKKGGTSVSKDRRYMAEIGRKGGRATAQKSDFKAKQIDTPKL